MFGAGLIVAGAGVSEGSWIGSLGGAIMAFTLIFIMLDADKTQQPNSVLVEHGLATYVGNPTNGTSEFVLIDKDGKYIYLKKGK